MSTRSSFDGDNVVVTLRPSAATDPVDIVNKLAQNIARRKAEEIVQTTEDGVVWFRINSEDNTGDIPTLAMFGGELIIGVSEAQVRKVLDSRTGKLPTLATYAATQGLPAQASAYMYAGMKGLMADNNDFAGMYGMLRDGAGVAAAIIVDNDRCVIQTNRSVSSVIGAFASAQGMYENQRKERRAIQSELELVAKAYADYRTLNGKNPISLESLGFTGPKALKYPGQGSESSPAKPYILVPTGDGDLTDARDIIVVTCGDPRFGRLVGTLNGMSRSLSESQYQAMIRNQRAPK
jgi:hypothetical protein